MHRGLLFSVCGLFVCLVGCSGGGGGSATSRSVLRQRVKNTTRVAHSLLAITGMGRHAPTRSLRFGMGRRAQAALSTQQKHRETTQGQDEDTKLYYRITQNADGSARQDLFTDAAFSSIAGNYAYQAPIWTNGVPNTYPVFIRSTYEITAGDFAGDRGALDIMLTDATGDNGTIHATYANAKGEHCDATFDINAGRVSAHDTLTFDDGSTCEEYDDYGLNDVWTCRFIFSDGSRETITTDDAGKGTQTYLSASGETLVSGSYDDTGSDSVTYSDGSTETFDIGTDSSSDSSNSSSAERLRARRK